MKQHLSLTALSFAVGVSYAAAAGACPWAGGIYAFKSHGFSADFTVNDGCTEMVWSRLSSGPETSALAKTKDGWKGQFSKGDIELLENGENLRFTGTGGPMRQSRAERKN